MKWFDDVEFQCPCCGQMPENGMNKNLTEKLDQLRERIGQPIIVTSGYRCFQHNEEVGGVYNSQHRFGNAADIYCPSMDVEELYEYVMDIGFDGIGLYLDQGFIHVDCRDDGESPNYYTW